MGSSLSGFAMEVAHSPRRNAAGHSPWDDPPLRLRSQHVSSGVVVRPGDHPPSQWDGAPDTELSSRFQDLGRKADADIPSAEQRSEVLAMVPVSASHPIFYRNAVVPRSITSTLPELGDSLSSNASEYSRLNGYPSDAVRMGWRERRLCPDDRCLLRPGGARRVAVAVFPWRGPRRPPSTRGDVVGRGLRRTRSVHRRPRWLRADAEQAPGSWNHRGAKIPLYHADALGCGRRRDAR